MKRALFLGTLALGCVPGLVQNRIDSSVAPAPSTPWTPPAEAKGASAVPQGSLDVTQVQSLPALLEYGLAHNPTTRQAFESAKAASAQLGSKESLWWPTLTATVNAGYQQQALGGGSIIIKSGSVTPSASLSYLLLDLGTRAGDIGEARELLYAANFAQNQAIQDEMLKVEQAYFGLLAAKGLLVAQQATVEEAKASAEAARARHENGVATVADVLQAKTAYSQAQLNVQTAQGQLAAQQGALANALGLKASQPIAVGELPALENAKPVGDTVDRLIEQAYAQRPDLARARSQALAAGEHVSSVRGKGLPTLNLNANAGRSYFLTGTAPYGDNFGASVVLSIPIFDGFKDSNDLAQAEAQERAAKAQEESVAEQVSLQVWDSYQAVQTAQQQLATAKDLLESATESQKVAAGRYHDGVGTIIDLLTAEAQLANARSQEVQARANWLLAMASLAHDTGNLNPAGSPPAQGTHP